MRTFYWNDVPEFDGEMTRGMDPEGWKRVMGMTALAGGEEEKNEGDPAFMIIPSPAFQNDLDDLLRGLQYAFPEGQTFGGIASTVSSLSRARIFAYSDGDGSSAPAVYGNGCVGVAFSGDVTVDTMIAQGAKPGESMPGVLDSRSAEAWITHCVLSVCRSFHELRLKSEECTESWPPEPPRPTESPTKEAEAPFPQSF